MIRRTWITSIAGAMFASLVVGGVIAAGAYYVSPEATSSTAPQQVALADLKTEILTDPKGLGYSGQTPFRIAALLNTVGLSGEVVDREFVSTDVIQSQVVASEYLLLLSGERNLWETMLKAAGTDRGVPVANPNIRNQVTALWGAGTQTRANLIALQTRPGSRAEVLFGDGTIVSRNEIEKALLLP